MKKQELKVLTEVIEHIVVREVRKQLPIIIAETFQSMVGKRVVTEQKSAPHALQEQIEPNGATIGDDPPNFKASLRELFAGTTVMKTPLPENQPKQLRQFTKNPILNQILNETTPDLRQREGMVGMAAFQGGYSPTTPGITSESSEMTIPNEPDPSFVKNMPTLPTNTQRSRPQVFQEGVIAPTSIPAGVPAAVKGALTRNYSQMMKLIDKKKKGIA